MSKLLFTSEDLAAIAAATTFTELAEIAKNALGKVSDDVPVIGIADPISNQPTGNWEQTKPKLQTFEQTTELLISAGYTVFDERPFLEKVCEIKEAWFIKHKNEHPGFCKGLVEEFFKPVLETGKIRQLLLLPEWISSYTSYWEEGYAAQHGIKIIELPFDWGKTTSSGLDSIKHRLPEIKAVENTTTHNDKNKDLPGTRP